MPQGDTQTLQIDFAYRHKYRDSPHAADVGAVPVFVSIGIMHAYLSALVLSSDAEIGLLVLHFLQHAQAFLIGQSVAITFPLSAVPHCPLCRADRWVCDEWYC